MRERYEYYKIYKDVHDKKTIAYQIYIVFRTLRSLILTGLLMIQFMGIHHFTLTQLLIGFLLILLSDMEHQSRLPTQTISRNKQK